MSDDEKKASRIVTDLLSQFDNIEKQTVQKSSPTGKYQMVSRSDKSQNRTEQLDLDIDFLADPENLAPCLMLLMSTMLTMAQSVTSGYAENILYSMLPELAKKLEEEAYSEQTNSNGATIQKVKPEHVSFVRSLLRPGLKEIIRADDALPPEDFSIPGKVSEILTHALALAAAFHVMGKQNTPMTASAGLKKSLVHFVTKVAVSGGLLAENSPKVMSVIERNVDILFDNSTELFTNPEVKRDGST